MAHCNHAVDIWTLNKAILMGAPCECERAQKNCACFLAYFPKKMKLGLLNHQYVCLSVCVSPINNFWTVW
jgi:hypothetical protein